MSVPYKNDGMTGMTKAELVEEVARTTQLTKKHAEIIVNTVFDSIVDSLKGGEKIEGLMTSLSEDPGSAKSGEAYPVTPDAGLVEPFKNLSLRLKAGEVGAVKTDFGIHIVQRCSKDDGQPADPCIQK